MGHLSAQGSGIIPHYIVGYLKTPLAHLAFLWVLYENHFTESVAKESVSPEGSNVGPRY